MAASPVRPYASGWRRAALVGLSWIGVAGGAVAQYKVVAPDGSVTYTDRAPANDKSRVAPMRAGTAGAAGATGSDAGLPYALRQVMARYPVTLYTSPVCAPCDTARQFLRQRGVPVTERSVLSGADVGELNRLEQTTDLPIVRLGTQRLVGFSAGEWSAMLDAAGYPRESVLPANHRQPAAQPLVPARSLEPATNVAPALSPPAPPPPTAAGAGGIRF